MASRVVKHSEYNVESFEFSNRSNPKKKTLHAILLPTYNGGRPLIQLPEITLDMYGVPSKCDFYKEDSQRLFLKLPLRTKIKEIKELAEGLFKQRGDKLASSNLIRS